MKEKIQSNIETSGRHVTCVGGGESPRYFYTVGLSAKVGFELVLAGLAHIPEKAGIALLNTLSRGLESGKSVKKLNLEFRKFGSFTLAQADASWTTSMIFEALDYYDRDDIKVMQVLPEPDRATNDIPPICLL